jgi:hypothetical protein
MVTPLKRFQFRLAPLLRRDEWERDLLGGEVARAGVLADECRQRLQAAQAQVLAAEERMRDLHHDDQAISLEARQWTHEFLRHAHTAAGVREAESNQAGLTLEVLRGQFERKQVAVRTLLRHEDRQRQEHDCEQGRLAQAEADAQWLMRRNRR